MKRLEKFLLFFNTLIYISLTVFSYAYVDLNLTISQNTTVLDFVGNLQKLGYFNRPQATIIFISFLIVTFGFLILNLFFASKGKIGKKYLYLSTVLNTFILIFSYPFLSSDLFNYMFDAKIIATYHLNPYTHKPLDFPSDDWLRFMRWTHRYSPYGPVWLIYSLIPTILGFKKFLLTFFMFKIFIGIFHIFNTYLIYKIVKKDNENYAILAPLLYSLNPLFLIEGVVNAHNDIILAFVILSSVYFFQQKRLLNTYLLLIFGALIKYITIINIPWLFLISMSKFNFLEKRKTLFFILTSAVSFTFFIYMYSSVGVVVPFVSSTGIQIQFQPWYLFWVLPLIILLGNKTLNFTVILLSFSALLRYLPYIYYGDWSHNGTIKFMFYLILSSVIISVSLFIHYLKALILKNK